MLLSGPRPEAVQITGLLRFRQPCFLDITYTRRYVWWFLPGTFVCISSPSHHLCWSQYRVDDCPLYCPGVLPGRQSSAQVERECVGGGELIVAS